MNSIYWLLLIIVLLVIEIITLGLTTIWFAGGALVAFILCLLDLHWKVQWTAFIAVSFLLLVFTRPLAVKRLNQKTQNQKTNVDSLAGRLAVVTETIDNDKGTGSVSVNGQIWTARSVRAGEVFEPGEKVVAERIEGVKIFVSRAEA